MSFKKKLKKAFKNIIGDFTGVEWKNLDHKKVYGVIAAAVVVMLLIVVLILNAVLGGEKSEKVQEPAEEIAETAEPEEEAVPENPLEVDAYEGINDLIATYFQGYAAGDTELVESTVDVLTDEEKLTIQRKKDYVEAYNNLVCYTKKGLEENSYIVFAAYEMKFYKVETEAPGIQAFYVCTGENGELYIFNGDAPEELQNYVNELVAEEEVSAIIADVASRYQQLLAEDEELAEFIEYLEQSQEEEAEEEAPEEPVDGDETAAELEEPVETTVNDGIRIREGRSTDSRMLATIISGTKVKVYANYEDGWSKIEYEGTVGYCKTEFLESTEGVPTLSDDAQAEDAAEEEDADIEETSDAEENEEAGESEESEEAEATQVNKRMQIKETIRIRSERSTESERLANAYTNELVTVIESYSDGWSKVDYNGTIGYCKTEFLKEAE